MKKRILVLLAAASMLMITACSSKEESTEAKASKKEETTTAEDTAEATTTEETKEEPVETTTEATTEATSVTTTETTTSEETTEATRMVEAEGWDSFVMPAEDTTYIDKLIEAGIAPEYYRGTYIAFTETDEKNGDMIIYFVNNNTNPSGKVYDFTDAGDALSEEDANEATELVRESFYCYFDYYENYDGREAIDLNGDGQVTNTEKNICAFFTCDAEFRGLMIDQIC